MAGNDSSVKIRTIFRYATVKNVFLPESKITKKHRTPGNRSVTRHVLLHLECADYVCHCIIVLYYDKSYLIFTIYTSLPSIRVAMDSPVLGH